MPVNAPSIIAEIDAVLARYEEVEQNYKTSFLHGKERVEYIKAPDPVSAEVISLLQETINRLAPVKDYGAKALEGLNHTNASKFIRSLAGVLKSLRADYAAGRVQGLQERIRSDVFSDFLETAEYLIEDEGLKDPAPVLAGGVLEQHIRKLCGKHGVAVPDKGTIDPLNVELRKTGVYGGNEQKQVTAWAAIRNSAAHAKYSEYTADQVKLMIQGLRLFMSAYPA